MKGKKTNLQILRENLVKEARIFDFIAVDGGHLGKIQGVLRVPRKVKKNENKMEMIRLFRCCINTWFCSLSANETQSIDFLTDKNQLISRPAPGHLPGLLI